MALDLQAISERIGSVPQGMDLGQLEDLEDLLGDQFATLLSGFIETAQDSAQRACLAMEQHAYDPLRREAHAITGSALNLGANHLANCWSSLEQLVLDSNSSHVEGRHKGPEQLTIAKRELQQVVDYLNRLLEELA